MKYSERGISQCILPVMKCCETKNSFIYIVLIKHSLVVKLGNLKVTKNTLPDKSENPEILKK